MVRNLSFETLRHCLLYFCCIVAVVVVVFSDDTSTEMQSITNPVA